MEEDMILPEGFDDTPTAEPEVETQEMDSDSFEPETVEEPTSETTEPVQANTEPETIAQMLKIKYNSEEREIPLEEAAILAQKGLNYEKAIERARQEAEDAAIARLGLEWNGKPIQTMAEYTRAKQEEQLIQSLQQKGYDLPEEIMQEIIESRRDREERQKERQVQEEQQKKAAEIDEFLEYFQSVNERPFDSTKDAIPEEVKAAVEKGQPLKVAFMEYQVKQYRNQLKIAKQNEANTKRAPIGSVTAHGGTKTEPEDLFLQGFNSF